MASGPTTSRARRRWEDCVATTTPHAYRRSMQPSDVVPLQDVSRADWLVQASTGRQGRVRDYLPEGYQAYLRLPLVDADGEGVPLRQWLGRLRDVLARHTGTPDRCWFSLWEGFPVPQWWRESAPTFHLPHREHLLFAGRLEDLLVIAGEFACAGVEYADGSFVVDVRGVDEEGDGPGPLPERYPGDARLVPRAGDPEAAVGCREAGSCVEPSLWWPQDRAWVLAREVDSDAVYAAGSRALIEDLLTEPRLAAGEVVLDDLITIED